MIELTLVHRLAAGAALGLGLGISALLASLFNPPSETFGFVDRVLMLILPVLGGLVASLALEVLPSRPNGWRLIEIARWVVAFTVGAAIPGAVVAARGGGQVGLFLALFVGACLGFACGVSDSSSGAVRPKQ